MKNQIEIAFGPEVQSDIKLSNILNIPDELYYYRGQKQLQMSLRLTPTELILTPRTSSGKKVIWRLQDILGSEYEAGSYFRVYTCAKNKKGRRNIEEHTFRIEKPDGENIAKQWASVLSYLALPHTSDIPSVEEMCTNEQKQRYYLILINPVGGAGKANKIYNSYIAPLFFKCKINCEVKITEHANHALEIARELPTFKYDCVVAVGGDGFLAEIVQGLMRREDWQDAIRQPLGIIPGGSGNGLAHSICATSGEKCTPTNMAFIIAKGEARGLDIATTRSKQEIFYSFLSFEWAFISNVDIESEKYRCLGGARFTVSAIAKLCSSKKWTGKFSYLPSDDDIKTPLDYFQNEFPPSSRPALQYLPDIGDPIPNNWKTIEGDFSLFWAMSPSHAASDAIVYPSAKCDDGYMYVVVARGNLKMTQMASILLSLDKGTHVDTKYIEVIRTRAYQLETFDHSDLMVVDGELFGTDLVQVELHRKLGQIMCLDEQV